MSNLTERKKATTEAMMHEAICAAGIVVLHEVGPNGMTMSKVAEEAQVSKGTLYNYYEDKEALLMEVISRSFAPVVEEVTASLSRCGSPFESICEGMRNMIEGVEERFGLRRILADGDIKPRTKKHFRETCLNIRNLFSARFQEAIDLGLLRPGYTDATLLGRLFFGFVDSLIEERFEFSGECPSISQDIESLKKYVLKSWFKERK